MKKILIIISALIITAGCAKEEFRSAIGIGSEEICGVNKVTASIEDGTRATFNYEIGQQEWVPADEIAVATKRPIVKFVYSGEEQSAIGEFTSKETLVDTTLYYAAYPYSALDSVVFDKAGHWMAVKFPSKQTFDPSLSLAEGANLMVAKSTKKEENQPVFYFRNICSYIELVVLGPNDDKIESIVITSADHSAINGQAKVTWNGENPEVEFYGDGSDTNVITMEDGGLDFSEIPFDIAVPASLENGFSITIVTANGLEQTLTTDKGVGRNKYLKMKTIDFNAQGACAKIGETEYKSFKAAVEATNSSHEKCTIELISDCHTSTAEFKNLSPATLDLCGHRLTAVADRNISVSKESAGLTIKDSKNGQGTICQADRTSPVIDVFGDLTLDSGKIEADNTVVYIHAGSFTMNGGEINGGTSSSPALRAKLADISTEITGIEINGGSINSEKGRGLYTVGCTSTTINGGSIITSSYSVYVDEGQISITDGEFVSSSNTIYIASKGHGTIEGGHFFTDAANGIGLVINKTEGNLKMSGGYCSRTVSDGILETGYWLNPVEETFNGRVYNFNVEEKPVIEATLQIGDGNPLEYNSVTEAIKDAQGAIDNDCIVVLKANCKLTEKVEITSYNKITIDLNGFTMLGDGTKKIEVNGNESNVIIQSSAEGGRMEQSAAGNPVIIQNGGILTIESGELRSAANATFYTLQLQGGTTNINGGKIYGENSTVVYSINQTLKITGGEIEINNTDDDMALRLNNSSDRTGEERAEISGGKIQSLYVGSAVSSLDFKTEEGCRIEIGNLTTFFPFSIEAGNFGPTRLYAAADVNITGGEFTAAGSESALTLTGSKAVNISGGTFTAENGIALDVQKGTANVSGGEFTSDYLGIRTAYTTNISGGTVSVTGEEGKDAFALYLGNSSLETQSPAFNISAGKFSSSSRTLHRYSGNFSISGGTFIAANGPAVNAGSRNSPNVEVTGGYFSNSSDSEGIFTGANLNGKVSGGSFNKAINTEYLRPGCSLSTASPETIEGITYTHKVVGEYYAARIGDTKYGSFAEALTDANNSSSDVTITLLDSVSLSANASIANTSARVSIDLDGFSINEGTYYFSVGEGAKLSIMNSSEGGTVKGKGSYAIYTKNGEIEIKSGKVENTAKDAIYSSGGTVKVSGGSVTAKDSAAIVLYQSSCTISGPSIIKSSMSSTVAAQNVNVHPGAIAVIQSNLDITGNEATISNDAGIAVYTYGSSTINSIVNISGGTITGKLRGIYPYFRSTVNITGGNIESTYDKGSETSSYAAVYTNVTSTTEINISGGYFKGGSKNALKAGSATVGKLFKVTGGKYNISPVNDGNIELPAGYSLLDITEDDYKFEVVKN